MFDAYVPSTENDEIEIDMTTHDYLDDQLDSITQINRREI